MRHETDPTKVRFEFHRPALGPQSTAPRSPINSPSKLLLHVSSPLLTITGTTALLLLLRRRSNRWRAPTKTFRLRSAIEERKSTAVGSPTPSVRPSPSSSLASDPAMRSPLPLPLPPSSPQLPPFGPLCFPSATIHPLNYLFFSIRLPQMSSKGSALRDQEQVFDRGCDSPISELPSGFGRLSGEKHS